MRCWPIWRPSVGSTSTSPAIISGMAISASLPTDFDRFVRQQETCGRPLPPDRVPDLVLLTVLSCPFYVVTPIGRRFDRCCLCGSLAPSRNLLEHCTRNNKARRGRALHTGLHRETRSW